MQIKYTPTEALTWAKKACDAVMATYTPSTLPPAGDWHYHQGVFLLGMMRLWLKTDKQKYYDYAKEYVDLCIDSYGELAFYDGELDAVQGGNLLFFFYEKTRDERYKKAMDMLISLLADWNKTSDGGFWHKEKYPNQMWLDGVYMTGPFAVHYGLLFKTPQYYDIVTEQALLLEKHTRDKKTGLLRHAWDDSRKTPWCDPETGQAPELWGRAQGWYLVALLDILDYLPRDHKDRLTLIEIFKSLCAALRLLQDKKTGLWYQVLDKGERADNWLETSCSSLFVYAFAKGIVKGYIDAEYAGAALTGFSGMISKTHENDEHLLQIEDICIGTGVGDYAHYVNRPRKTNDLHGVGAFALACLETAELLALPR